MIIYKSGDWLEALRHLHTSAVIRKLLKIVVLVGVYGTIVAVFELELLHLHVQVDGQYFSFLGIMLSLLLAFRTNTAYDRFYEGRRVWGQLVNNCRNMATLLNARLPADAFDHRIYLAKLLSNFPIALDGHLRHNVKFHRFEEPHAGFVEELRSVNHVPARVAAALQEYFELLLAEGLILPEHLITLQRHHETLLDVAGICERIQKTPIPFSYSFFIKGFITTFILVMPFVLLENYSYFMVPISMFGAYALLGVELIGDEIEDPFGKDSNDLPLTQLANNIRRNVFEIMHVELNQEKKDWAAAQYSVVF